MFNHFFAALAAHLQAFLVGARGRVAAPARGANFIEYALLAVLAVIIFTLFRTQLTSIFTDLLGRVRGAAGSV